MIELKFNKGIFRKNYGIIYRILQYLFMPGFMFILTVLVLPANTITLHPTFIPLGPWLLLISLVGYPIVTLLRMGQQRLIISSKLSYSDDFIYYDKLTDMSWSAIGRIEEHQIYRVKRVESIVKSRFYYTITGDIEKVVVNNGRQLSNTKVGKIKIPNSFLDMDGLLRMGDNISVL